jgi:hypothetical protein
LRQPTRDRLPWCLFLSLLRRLRQQLWRNQFRL